MHARTRVFAWLGAVALAATLGCNGAAEPTGPSAAIEITDANFDETIQSGVTLVDFWAPWCPPCRMQGPIVEKLADAYRGRAKIGKLNVDDNDRTATRYGVRSIPTLILFKDGKDVQQFVGLQGEAKLKAALDAQLR